MRHRVKPWRILLCFAVLTVSFHAEAQRPDRRNQRGYPPAEPSGPAPPPGGIGQASDQLAAQALDLLNNGKLAEAAAAYSTLLEKYPNSGAVPEAMFRLGYIQYVQGEYATSVATLRRIASPPASPEIKAAGDALIPQVLATQAAKMPAGDPGRKAALADAVRQFDDFIRKNPTSPEVETAGYGRAVAAYQMQDYEKAVQSLQDNLERFPKSPSIQDSEDLLAVVLIGEASSIIAEHGDREAAMEDFQKALGYLADIFVRHSDVALANDAQFQIGEVLFNRGSAEEGAKRTEDLENAIIAYRAVQPKDMMVQAQQARVQALLPQLRQAVQTGVEGLQAAQRLLDRENAKLNALKAAPDQTMNAQLRIVGSYFLLQKYDEARVLLRYLEGFADNDADKKQIEYYLVLTYASQGITDKAVAAYNDFQSKYKGDPLGENLPLAMGAAFLTGANPQPDKAIDYLQDEVTLYPKSPLVNQALEQEASALIGLQRYGDALAAYQKFLDSKPPADQAAQAEQGIALIYQQTGKLPEAIRQYQKVADTYPGTPQAEQGAFYAAGLETSVDMKLALLKLQIFVKSHPDGKFTAQAMMMTAQAQAALGDAPGAMATYKQVETTYSATEYGPQAYFAQATLLAREEKTDDMVKLMQDFIKVYPANKDIFYAYDTIGQTQARNGNLAAAVATYAEMADKHADNPMAATALYRTADLWRKQADGLGQYQALKDAQRKDWNTDLTNSIAAGEKLLDQFSGSDQVGVDLKNLLADQEMLVAAGLKTPEDVDKYFHGLADKFHSNLGAQSRILFTLATFTYQKDPVTALLQMAGAYRPTLVYAPEDLDLYGSALIDQGKADEAFAIYQKIANDYPIPQGIQPAQAQPAIQEAQATALFGMASALDKEGKTADAAKLYSELKTYYPWSSKVVEANFGIAKSLFQQNKLNEALALLVGIVGNRNATATLRARALLLVGDIQAAKGNVPAAIDSYMKTAAFYGGVAEAAAEALWKGGRMLEKQAAALNEQSTPKRSEQIAKAVSAYQDIVSKYPNSQFVQPAQDRLNVLAAR